VSTIYKGTYPFIAGMAFCLIVFVLFPQISLWLPNLLMGK
jgi:TRAP-type C4-dicarboxylate transport system permease large subunit